MSLYGDQLNKVSINGIEASAGSYKGVAFFVENSSGTDGRRIQTNEFPNQDKPIFEDVGRVSNIISVTGYFLDYGENVSAIEQFESAKKAWSESAGAGTLIHPQRQSILQARCGVITDTNTKTNSIVKFSAEFFVEEEVPQLPKTINFKNKILGQNQTLLDTVLNTFESVFDTINKPQSVIKAAINSARDVLTVIEAAKNGLRQTAGYIEKLRQLEQNIALIIDDVGSLGEQLIDLIVYKPANAVSESILINDGFSLASAPTTQVATGVVPTADIQTQDRNNQQLNQLVTVAGLTVISENSLDVEIESVQQSNELIQSINDTFDSLTQNTLDYEVFERVQELKTTVIDALELRTRELPAIRIYNINETTTALNVSADLYNTYLYSDDIINRNNVKNPFFIESGSSLEVLI